MFSVEPILFVTFFDQYVTWYFTWYMMTKQNILVLKLIQTEFRKREMERLLRLGGQGLSGMGSQSPESSQNDTAEQVKHLINRSK